MTILECRDRAPGALGPKLVAKDGGSGDVGEAAGAEAVQRAAVPFGLLHRRLAAAEQVGHPFGQALPFGHRRLLRLERRQLHLQAAGNRVRRRNRMSRDGSGDRRRSDGRRDNWRRDNWRGNDRLWHRRRDSGRERWL